MVETTESREHDLGCRELMPTDGSCNCSLRDRDAEVARIGAVLSDPDRDWGAAGPLDELAAALYAAGLRSTSRDSEVDPKPDHQWNDPDGDGHDCADCPDVSMWKCDPLAHISLDHLLDDETKARLDASLRANAAARRRGNAAAATMPLALRSTSRDSEVREALLQIIELPGSRRTGEGLTAKGRAEAIARRALAILDRSSEAAPTDRHRLYSPDPATASEAWEDMNAAAASEAAPTRCFEDFTPEGGSFGPCPECGSETPHVRLAAPALDPPHYLMHLRRQ